MKRLLAYVFVAVMLIACVPQPGGAEGLRIGFFANLGFMTKERVSPNWLTMGAEIGLPLGAGLSLNPEVALWGGNFRFSSYYIVPGALLNFRIGRFSIGAGAIRRFWHSRYAQGDSTEKIAPKIQVGYLSRNSRIAFIVVPFSTPKYVSVGVALGLGF